MTIIGKISLAKEPENNQTTTISNIVTSNLKRETLQTLSQISTEARYKQWQTRGLCTKARHR